MKWIIVLLFVSGLHAAESQSKKETPFFNEHFAGDLDREFQKFRTKMQELEARVRGDAKEASEKGSKAIEESGQSAKKSGKKALLKLADELEDTAKSLRKKANE